MGAYAGREKYDEPGRAAAYAARNPKRHAEEWALVERALAGRPWPETVIDVPCGAGRLSLEFIRRGSRVLGADLSPAMREQAAAALNGNAGWLGVRAMDLEAPDAIPEESAELVLCMRFLHHLPDAVARAKVISRLSRLSKSLVVVSFHHPVSAHQLARAARRLLTLRRGDRHTLTLGRLAREAAPHGLVLSKAVALSPWLRELWIAVFEKRAE